MNTNVTGMSKEEIIITTKDVDIEYFIEKDEIRDRLDIHYKLMKKIKL